MYWLSISVTVAMIGHIQDAETLKDVWDTLVKLYSTNTKARKMQLKQELHTVKKMQLSINDYSLKVKGLADALASIGSPVEDDDLVSVTLNGLSKEYDEFRRTSIQTRENFSNFQDLISLLITEEMNVGSKTVASSNVQEQAF
ncbi:retrotransposon gag domain-containing protein, partial [Escherichia coli]|uniref:hypothetical protein n=1 Tax=Escherichia coli TaxID=562 RepID=UPI00257916A2